MTLTSMVSVVIVALSLLGCITFATLYWLWFPWWVSAAGRNLFAFVAVDGLINVGFMATLFARTNWLPWLRWVLIAFYALQPVVIWWRVHLIVKVHREQLANGPAGPPVGVSSAVQPPENRSAP